MTDQHHTRFIREFGDGRYAFAMLLGGIRELETKRKIGINDLYVRILSGHWFADDIREVVRVGLIEGGEVKPTEALRLVERYVDARPLLETWDLAVNILQRVLMRDETEKKSEEIAASGSADTIGTPSTATVQ